MDENWNFKEHVLQKCCAAHYRLKQVYPARHFLSTGSKLMLSQALILSLFNYVNTVFGPCISVRTAGRIQRIQNSCLRFSYGIRKYNHISPSLQMSGWLNMRQRWILYLCCMTHKILHTGTPSYLRELLATNLQLHQSRSSTTRQAAQLTIPRHHSTKFRGSFSYAATYYYNQLPGYIKAIKTIKCFRQSAETYLKDAIL